MSKSIGINDCEQSDSGPRLDAYMLDEICGVITEVETRFKKNPTLEFMNMEIFRILAGRKKAPVLKWILRI